MSYPSEQGLTFLALREANRKRASASKFARCEAEWTLAHWMQATVGELGELANILKKVDRGDLTLDEAREELAREFADVQTYLDRMADKAGVDLAEATVSKFNEVSDRINCPVRLSDSGWYLTGCPAEVAHTLLGLEGKESRGGATRATLTGDACLKCDGIGAHASPGPMLVKCQSCGGTGRVPA